MKELKPLQREYVNLKNYIETKQTEIVQNCRQTVSQIKYQDNYALDKGLNYIKANETQQFYLKSYPLLKHSADFHLNPLSSCIAGFWSLFGKDGMVDYVIQPNPLDAVKYLGQAIVNYEKQIKYGVYMQNYNIDFKTIQLLYGLSLILASEFSNFEDLKNLLEQQGVDISKINDKNDIIQLGIDIVNDAGLLNKKEEDIKTIEYENGKKETIYETIHNIIEKLKDIKYNEETYNIFKCTEKQGSGKYHHNINDILRIIEYIVQQHEKQQQTEQEQNDNLSIKLGELLTNYEKNHRTVNSHKNSILPIEKLENTLQILQQRKIQIDEQQTKQNLMYY